MTNTKKSFFIPYPFKDCQISKIRLFSYYSSFINLPDVHSRGIDIVDRVSGAVGVGADGRVLLPERVWCPTIARQRWTSPVIPDFV